VKGFVWVIDCVEAMARHSVKVVLRRYSRECDCTSQVMAVQALVVPTHCGKCSCYAAVAVVAERSRKGHWIIGVPTASCAVFLGFGVN